MGRCHAQRYRHKLVRRVYARRAQSRVCDAHAGSSDDFGRQRHDWRCDFSERGQDARVIRGAGLRGGNDAGVGELEEVWRGGI